MIPYSLNARKPSGVNGSVGPEKSLITSWSSQMAYVLVFCSRLRNAESVRFSLFPYCLVEKRLRSGLWILMR